MDEPDLYLIWSHEHKAWWGPGGYGYSQKISRAGRYTREQALHICANAIPATAQGLGALPELPVRLADLNELVGAFAVLYSTEQEPWL